jgi:hypothetical protein
MWNIIVDLLDSAMNRESLCAEGKRLMALYHCPDPNAPAPGDKTDKGIAEKPLLYITGHSLGGALAVLAAARIFTENRLYKEYWNVLQNVHTFGQPMVGDREFATRFEEPFKGILFRHVYDHDVFPRLPPRTAGAFWHIGEEYVSTKTGWAYQSKGVSQARTLVGSTVLGVMAFLMDQLAGIPILERLPRPYSVRDHSLLGYLRVSQMTHPAAALL